MKVFAAALALLLLAASFSQTFSGPVGPDFPICCFKFTRHELPRDRVLRHYSTSTSCPQPGIVFITTRGRQVCANPADSWVQRYLQSLEQN
ncbi:C-C motif chemokine 4-like [Empidonax traillii]|uniref:C-C motif chemokine 4-like n=1 Tax=Empidonax traillii TaxID=164674 RepID=UPI000FFD0BED|nr:C-C motif chemokine 4-like [Empidonax traillii]XP_027752126.1 C-C motif chemokine 4-like [Empidonax traillii]